MKTPHERSDAEARTAKVASKPKVNVIRNPKLRAELAESVQAAARMEAYRDRDDGFKDSLAAHFEWMAWHLRQQLAATTTPSSQN